MDADFEQHYQAAEWAYGLEQYQTLIQNFLIKSYAYLPIYKQ